MILPKIRFLFLEGMFFLLIDAPIFEPFRTSQTNLPFLHFCTLKIVRIVTFIDFLTFLANFLFGLVL